MRDFLRPAEARAVLGTAPGRFTVQQTPSRAGAKELKTFLPPCAALLTVASLIGLRGVSHCQPHKFDIEQFYGIALPAESFAQVVVFAISQPQEVDVNEIVLAASPIWDHPTANGFDVSDHCDPKR